MIYYPIFNKEIKEIIIRKLPSTMSFNDLVNELKSKSLLVEGHASEEAMLNIMGL